MLEILEKCPKSANIAIIYGIHGQSTGNIGQYDENLVSCFKFAIENKNVQDLKNEKNLTIRTIIPRTKEIGRHKYEIENSDEVMKAVEESNFLLLAFCYTSFNELNTLFRSKGYYASMTLDLEFSKFLGYGKMIKMDPNQKRALDDYTKNHPQMVLLGGDYGSGKTILLSQMVSIRLSQLEMDENLRNKKINLIISVDVESPNAQLLEDYKTMHLGFIKQEINERRKENGLDEINVKYVTFK